MCGHLEVFQENLLSWVKDVQGLVDPLLNQNQPLMDAINRTNEAFHHRHHIAGIWNYHM
jgi:hypothetical protein